MEIKYIDIISKGDPSVGWFGAEWRIQGPLTFENHNEFLEFKEKLLTAFSVIADDCFLKTNKQFEEELRLLTTETKNYFIDMAPIGDCVYFKRRS